MSKLVITTSDHRKVLQHALQVDPAAFYVGTDSHAVTGGSLTASVCDGGVVITSNRFSEEQLRTLFARFLGTGDSLSPKT